MAGRLNGAPTIVVEALMSAHEEAVNPAGGAPCCGVTDTECRWSASSAHRPAYINA